MISRRNFRLCLFSAGIVLAGLLIVQRLTQRTPFDRSHFNLLRTGMSAREVEQVLGGSARNEFRERVTVWLPAADSTSSYFLRPKTPAPSFFPDARPADEQRLWVGDEGLIAVLFDAEGRLVEKYYSDVHVPSRPSAMDTVKHVLGS